MGEQGKAVGIEHIGELVKESTANVKKAALTSGLLERGVLKFVVGDGRQGLAEEGPYDAIHVGAAAPTLPEAVSGMWAFVAVFIFNLNFFLL